METTAKKPRLLLIEDNSDTRQIYKDVFERDGFQVLLAEDGEKGLSYAQSTLPDVILLDLMLPKLHGFDVLTNIRTEQITKAIPVIIISVLEEPADKAKAIELGANDYIVKSHLSHQQILSRVDALLNA